MNKKNKNWIYTLIVIGFVLITINSCKKDDDPIENSIAKGLIGPTGGTIRTSEGAYLKIEPNVLAKDIEFTIQLIPYDTVAVDIYNISPNSTLEALGGLKVSISPEQYSNILSESKCEIGIPISPNLRINYTEINPSSLFLMTDQSYFVSKKFAYKNANPITTPFVGITTVSIENIFDVNIFTAIFDLKKIFVSITNPIITPYLKFVNADYTDMQDDFCQSAANDLISSLYNLKDKLLVSIESLLSTCGTFEPNSLDLFAGKLGSCKLKLKEDLYIRIDSVININYLKIAADLSMPVEIKLSGVKLAYEKLFPKINNEEIASIQGPISGTIPSQINILGIHDGKTELLAGILDYTATAIINFSLICPEKEIEIDFESPTIFFKPPATIKVKGAIYNGHFYYKSLKSLNWPEAKTYTESLGGHLEIINDAEENNFLFELCNHERTLIGLTDEAQEGIWKWVDGSLCRTIVWNDANPECKGKAFDYADRSCLIITDYSYQYWRSSSNEPNNSGGAENYAILEDEGLWNDVPGVTNYNFIIEWDYIPGDEVLNKLMEE